MSNEDCISYSATQDFLSTGRRSSALIASGVMLCIFSPIVLLILISLTRLGVLTWSINFATGIGVVVLLAFTAAAITLFVAGDRWFKVRKNYGYEDCDLSNNIRKEIIRENKVYENQHVIFKIIGITFCVLSAILLMSDALLVDVLASSRLDDLMTGFSSATLLLAGIDVFFLVKTNIIHDSFNIIPQLDDYTSEKKAGKKLIEKYAITY